MVDQWVTRHHHKREEYGKSYEVKKEAEKQNTEVQKRTRGYKMGQSSIIHWLWRRVFFKGALRKGRLDNSRTKETCESSGMAEKAEGLNCGVSEEE